MMSQNGYLATLDFVCNGTNKFSKQVDQSLMNSYLIDGLYLFITNTCTTFKNLYCKISNGIYFAKQNNNM